MGRNKIDLVVLPCSFCSNGNFLLLVASLLLLAGKQRRILRGARKSALKVLYPFAFSYSHQGRAQVGWFLPMLGQSLTNAAESRVRFRKVVNLQP